jgi:hypothetical protein
MHDPFWLEFVVRSRQERLRSEAAQERVIRLAQDAQRRLAGRRQRSHHAIWQIGAWLIALGSMLQARFSEGDPACNTGLEIPEEAPAG